MNKVILWGLRSAIDSYKFIQSSFHQNALRMGYESIWVDDLETNKSLVSKGDIIFAVDRAQKFLPVRNDVRYVLHNISGDDLGLESNFIQIQIFDKNALGVNLGIPWVQWDKDSRTLFQPWGIPTPPRLWKPPSHPIKRKEFWMGSIWNDEANRGNSQFMEKYIYELKKQGIQFFRRGTPTRFQKNGISEKRGQRLVNQSIIGAAVLGELQRKNLYVPCRLFKNIASGVPPSSNGDFSEVFQEGIFDSNPEKLIAKVLNLTKNEREEIVSSSQTKMLQYTYAANLNRLFERLL